MVEVSVIIPCLNEEESIATCIEKVKEVYQKQQIAGEIIVVDNGSSDRSVEIARQSGARVIFEEEKGYGRALRRGIGAAQGQYIIMGDGDDTYDFREIYRFIELLRQGYDLVMGSRFAGKILPGAMTWSHRYIGNPLLSGMLRFLFKGKISDAHCGLRAFTKAAYEKMGLHTTGMEFASEMVIHALKKNMRIAEVPITYHPRKGQSKLSSLRDAWRHIRFMLLYSPDYLFLGPGLLIFLFSFLVLLRLLFGPIYLFGRSWDIHVLVFAAMFTLLGWQVLNLALVAKIFARQIELEEDKDNWFLKIINLEKLLVFGIGMFIAGTFIIGRIFYIWAANNFGELSQIKTALFALTLVVMGLQTVFSAFLTSMLQIKYRS